MNIKAKFVFLGDSQVGKTSIIVRYKQNEFDYNIITTVGNMSYDTTLTVNNRPVELQINDTAGQERYRSMTSVHFKDAQIIALVYDVTNEETIYSLKNWIEQVEQDSKVRNVIFLVGNKADLLEVESIDSAEIDETVQELMDKYNLPHLFTSAKSNINIKELFVKSTEEALKRNIFDDSVRETVPLTQQNLQKKKTEGGGCC